MDRISAGSWEEGHEEEEVGEEEDEEFNSILVQSSFTAHRALA